MYQSTISISKQSSVKCTCWLRCASVLVKLVHQLAPPVLGFKSCARQHVPVHKTAQLSKQHIYHCFMACSGRSQQKGVQLHHLIFFTSCVSRVPFCPGLHSVLSCLFDLLQLGVADSWTGGGRGLCSAATWKHCDRSQLQGQEGPLAHLALDVAVSRLHPGHGRCHHGHIPARQQ